ncbi:hypothetical protein [Brevibacillus choshinensis]|nr:hypothetical protein [Brevibacillus choshinensis]
MTRIHKEEIARVIHFMGGNVIQVKKVDDSRTPFERETGASNTVYQVLYEINGLQKSAWYRGVNVINNIHSKPNKGYEEKWVFDQ